jgi:hypothetical protein
MLPAAGGFASSALGWGAGGASGHWLRGDNSAEGRPGLAMARAEPAAYRIRWWCAGAEQNLFHPAHGNARFGRQRLRRGRIEWVIWQWSPCISPLPTLGWVKRSSHGHRSLSRSVVCIPAAGPLPTLAPSSDAVRLGLPAAGMLQHATLPALLAPHTWCAAVPAAGGSPSMRCWPGGASPAPVRPNGWPPARSAPLAL